MQMRRLAGYEEELRSRYVDIKKFKFLTKIRQMADFGYWLVKMLTFQ